MTEEQILSYREGYLDCLEMVKNKIKLLLLADVTPRGPLVELLTIMEARELDFFMEMARLQYPDMFPEDLSSRK